MLLEGLLIRWYHKVQQDQLAQQEFKVPKVQREQPVPYQVHKAHRVHGSPGSQGLPGKDGTNGTGAPVKIIGDSYQGGIVFYVDAGGQHGLIAARADQNTGVPWNNGINRLTGATGDGLGAGAMNTAIIVSTQISDNQGGIFAAKVAADYSVQDDGVSTCTVINPPVTETCYGDWYLPSNFELRLLGLQSNVVGGFANGWYWSSTDWGVSMALSHNLNDGSQVSSTKSTAFRVRAIRAF